MKNKRDILFWNRHYVEKMRKKIQNYDKDPEQQNRVKNQECKYCTYINANRIAGNAFTYTHCEKCGKEMIFPTTDTDQYCKTCAIELGICRHCGSEID